MREYDLIAEWYASERLDTRTGGGVPEVAALASSLPRGSRILDIGCGNGVPLTRALLAAGQHVVGIDSSREMLTRFRINCTDTPAVHGVIQRCPFRDQTFDAAVAWGVMFHLAQQIQIEAIACTSRVLRPGAPFLFTSGDADDDSGTHVGVMNGVEFHYYSFTIDGYRRILSEYGLALEDHHTDRGENLYFLARKRA